MTRRTITAIAGLVLIVGLWLIVGRIVTLETFLTHRAGFTAAIEARPWLALVVYGLIYTVVVALSLPVALPLTMIGGVLFGFWVGTAATATAATAGAVLLFLAARGLFHDYFVQKTERWLGTLRREFQADAASYLLLLRLTPVFPFAVVNLAAALLGTRLFTYLWTTFIGILPGTAAFTLTAAGLTGVIDAEAIRYQACLGSGRSDCVASLDFRAFLSRELALGLAAIALVMVLSVLARRIMRGRKVSDGQ